MSALVIFLGSFISFALEPMVGRVLLPVFGGAPTVWVTCLAAFQLLMVVGYGYAGFVGKGTCRWRIRTHLVLLGVAAAWCVAIAFAKNPILAALSSATGIPALDVFICVLVICALSFVLLSANATLVQSVGGGNYRLYAISNLGSFLGLFCYPVLVEPFVTLAAQWLCLAAAIVIYTALLFVLSGRPGAARSCSAVPPSAGRLTRGLSPLLYFLLPAVTAALLNATTAHLTLDIAPIPLLWALLLGLFLLSYVIGFSGWSRPAYWVVPAAIAASCSLSLYFLEDVNEFWGRLVCYSATLFLVATFVHSWLYAIRPPSERLSRYYLLNVLGGAAGGLATSLIAPIAFDSVLEFPLLLVLSAAAFLAWAFLSSGWLIRTVVVLALAVTCGLQLVNPISGESGRICGEVIHRARGFFGTLNVIRTVQRHRNGTTLPIHGFRHGNTIHGIEFLGGGLERMPTVYYTPFACGHAIIGHPSYAYADYVPAGKRNPRPMRVCLVGMGMGVSFAYARTNDFYRAYEISPEVVAVARDKRFFAFVDSCLVTPDIRIMDARKGLEAEVAANEERYDVILVDAFTGDSIPYHLSTKEAIELYLNRLKPDGILCIHFSNKYLDLRPYVKSIAGEFKLRSLFYQSKHDQARQGFGADVALFMRKEARIASLPIGSGMCATVDLSRVKPLAPFPTDEKGSFLPLVDYSGF